MAVTMESATFMGQNFQDDQNSILKTVDFYIETNVRRNCKISGRTR